MKLIDPELLRTLVTFADTGSLARTARVVCRSPSAVTAQMQRLEEVVGEAILAPEGRRRVLTPAGEDLLAHARRILDAQRDAWLSLAGARADGHVAIGMTQDFAETALTSLLRRFGQTHPRVRLELRVGRTTDLSKIFDEGRLDILLAMRGEPSPDEIAILREPMIWIGAHERPRPVDAELPLALLDAPCGFRGAALAALEAAGRPFRIAATSGSLSGLKAAVASGLAITVRTRRWLDRDLTDISDNMPKLPEATFSLALRRKAGSAAVDLSAALQSALAAEPPTPEKI